MKDYLENLEIGEGKIRLSEAEVKAILTEHGKVVQNEKTKIESVKDTEIENQKTTISDLKKQIDEMPTSNDVEALKTKLKEYEDAEAKRIEEAKAQKEQSVKEERTNAFFNEVKFASNSAKAGVIAEFNKMDFKYDEDKGKFIGASEWLEDYKKNDVGAFLSDVANPKFTTSTASPTTDSSMDPILRAMGLSEEKNK